MKTVAVLFILTLALLASPVSAASGQVFVPLAPVASDHFDDAQLAAAMIDAGYAPDDWNQYTSCVQDPQWTATAPLWSVCYTALDRVTGLWNAGYVEWTPATMAPHGVAWKVIEP